MTKIMLVEDDKSLREIYGVRLLAEGYDIVSAGDGEEALAVAIKERPGLIISDVMMPKISGFDMLDILRSTTETRNVKVIMMTALSSDEQRARGEQLGADRYLVKSQVGIEDVVRVVHEVLGDAPGGSPAPTSVTTAPATPTSTPPAPVSQPSQPPTTPTPAPQSYPTAPPPQSQPAAATPVSQPAPAPPPTTTPPTPTAPIAPPPIPKPPTPQVSTSQASAASTPSARNRVIQPINDPFAKKVDINDLVDKELAKEAGANLDGQPVSADQERTIINGQITEFEGNSNGASAQSATPPVFPPSQPSSTSPSTANPPSTDERQLPPPPPRPPVAL